MSAADPSSAVRPPTVAWAGAHDTPDSLRDEACPNCGAAAPKTMVLTIELKAPDDLFKRLRLIRCPACTCHFYDSQLPPDYAAPAMLNRGRVPFYVQQGAGVSLIIHPLARVRRPPGSTYMEVGCGYGFGLDFAINTRGWAGRGIDPAALSALGRDALNLPIELRYLRDDDEARGTMDVVTGSEVIEHVTSPISFVATLRAMLKPGGVLILTTPNGDDIAPETPPGIIVPMLSPTLHLVIQNRTSLTRLLQQAGFAHVQVDIDSHSLVAYASDAPLDLEQDQPTLRRALRDHLERRARAVDPVSDVFLGFAARAYQESVNDTDLAAADRAWSLLVPACRARFGLDLDSLSALPPAVATCDLETMARLVPLNLGGLLYARAIRRLTGGTPRAILEPQFLLAAEAAAGMRRALGALAMEDGQTEDIEWTARAEALLCAVDARRPDLLERFATLPSAPNGGEPRRRATACRAVADLVNAGRLPEARAFVAALGLERERFAQPEAELSDSERGWLFCLAVLDSEIGPDGQPIGDPALAVTRFRRVRTLADPREPLWTSALLGEAQALRLLRDDTALIRLAASVALDPPTPDAARWALQALVNGARYEDARALLARPGALPPAPSIAPRARLTTAEREDLFCRAIIHAQPAPDGTPAGDPAWARDAFRAVRQATDHASDLWWAAWRGEAQALRLLGDEQAVADLAEQVAYDITDPGLAAWALPSLVNAGRHAPARALATRSGLATAAFAQPGIERSLSDAERDLVFFLAILDVQTNGLGRPSGEPAVARGRFLRVRRACKPGSDLWVAALRGELQALDLLDAREDAQAVVAAMQAEHPGAALPPDILERVRST